MNALGTPDGLRTAFILLFVATVLTLYEIGLFFKVIVPTITEKIDDGLEKTANLVQDMPLDLLDIKLTSVFEKREMLLINKINDYTRYTGVLIIILLVIGLFIIKWLLNKQGHELGRSVWMNIIVTIALIGVFQYSFYQYGQKYNYMRDEELNGYLLNKLK